MNNSTKTTTASCVLRSQLQQAQKDLAVLEAPKGSSLGRTRESSLFQRGLILFSMLFALVLGVNAQTFTIGTGTTSTSSNGITPFSTGWHDGRTQYVYLASELTAAGLTAGSIHQFGFDWSLAGGQAALGVNVKMANTTATNITSLQTPTWTNVWSAASVSPTIGGYNLWTLTTPFVWNGVSNLIVEICFDNSGWSSNWGVRTFQFATGVSYTYGFYADGAAGCSMTTGTTASAANRRYRPNARFVRLAECSGTPTPGNTIAPATAAPGSTVNLSLQNATDGSGVTYQWQSGPSSTGPWTTFGTSASTQTSPVITDATWFKCNVTCGANTGNSTPVQVTLTYCTPTATSDDATGVTFVGFNTISNASASTPAYSNNTETSTSVFQNTAYPLTVRVNTAGFYTVNVLAWIDWNQNLTFEAGEQYNLGSAYNVTDGNSSASPFSITVPGTALLGNTRMRVRANWNVAPTACGDQSYSEAEDYTINVAVIPTCSGTPNTPTISGATSACPGANFTLNSNGTSAGIGITYQWQHSTDAGISWTDVSGETATSLTTNATVNKQFRLVTTCSGSGLTSTSAAYSVNITAFVACTCVAYSVVTASSSVDTEISSVTVGSMTNASNTCTAAAPGSGSIAGRYANFAGIIAGPTAVQGNSVPLTVVQGSCSGNNYGNIVQIYVDWNQNGAFTNDERVYESTSGLNTAPGVSGSFTVPTTALVGTTRMRIVVVEGGAAGTNYTNTAWSTFTSYGETEDYCFTVTAPVPPTISSVPASACLGSTVTISGSDFMSTTAVTFGGVPATSFTVVNSTTIQAVLSAPGAVVVTNAYGSATSSGNITFSEPELAAPVTNVSSVSPQFGQAVTLFVVDPSSSVSYNWYTSANPTIAFATGTTATTLACSNSNISVAAVLLGGVCESPRTMVSVTISYPQIISSTQQFCGVGSGIQLTATDLPTSASILWESLTPSAAFTLEASTANPASTTVSETSNFRLTVSVSGCPDYQTVKSIGVYPLPSATVTTSVSGVCPGTPVTINSGLSAGNFTTSDISSNINYSTPSNASSSVVTLIDNGAYVVAPSGSSYPLDDFYYSNINIPFSFDYFGNNYTSCNIGSNGVVSFGTPVASELQDYTFVSLPSATEPLNTVAACAHDMYYGYGGKISYWTQGYAPNRVFVVDYSGVGNFLPGVAGSTTSSQIKFYETLGIVEVSVLSTQATSNKIIGLQNADLDALVGVIANSTTSVYTNKSYRFSPPAEYSIIWTANSLPFEGGTGLNIFSLDLSPQVTTLYDISYANTATGCANLPGSAQATTVVLSAAPITGVVTTSTVSSVCSGSTVPLSHSYTGITDGLTYQWQDSIHGVPGWNIIQNATTSAYSVIQNVATSYRVGISRCGGVISYAAPLAIPMSIIAEPTITVSSPESSVCFGTPVTFTANIANEGTLPSACNYTFNLLDLFGDGWNGNTMSVRQGTTVVATLGFASGYSAAQTVSLQSGQTYTLFWNPTPTSFTYPGEVGINVVDPSGATIYSMPFYSQDLKGTTLTTLAPNCTSTATESLLAFSTIAWQVNDVAVAGANGLTYTTSSLNPSDVVTASVSVLLPCPSQTVFSLPAALVVTPALIPTITVASSASSVCQGAPVTFTATGSPANVGGPGTSCNYTFNMLDSFGDGWNGAQMQVMNGTIVVATLTGPANLNSGFEALPNSLAQTVSLQSGLTYTLFWNQEGAWPQEVGVQVINTSGVTVYSMDFDSQDLALTTLATFTPDCPVPVTYQWRLNGSPIAGVTGATYTSSALSTADVLTVSYSTNAPCYSTAPVLSSGLSVQVIPNTSVTTTVTAASSYIWAHNGQTYTASGVYTGTTTSCVTQMLNLTILPTLTLNVLLDGYYVIGSSPAEMRPARYNNLVAAIPSGPGYAVALAALSGNTQDVDLITVQLRGTTTGLPILHTATPMLKKDGSVICEFPASAVGGSYYVVVDHRASMPLWSQNPIPLTNSSTLNFANALASAYSDGDALLTPMHAIASGLYGIWMGELDQTGYLDAFDYSNLEGDIYESQYLGQYLLDGDLNGDSYVDATDFAVFDFNSIRGLYEQRPY